jgi:hypothetical protein
MGFVLLAVVVVATTLGGGVVARRSVLGKRMESTFEGLKSRPETSTEGSLSLRDRTRRVGRLPAKATASKAHPYQAPARRAS